MKNDTITITVPPKYREQAEQFFRLYAPENVITCPEEKMRGLKHKSERMCRFCGKKSGEVKFKKDAHVIPEALGNRYLVSDFECDECNHKFGRYEDDLMKYVGVIRTITRTRGKKKVANYVSPNFHASQHDFYGNENAIKLEGKGPDQVFEYDPENNQQTIRIKKPPYTPLNVYKALLKIALCSVDETDLKKYELAFQFLASPNIDKMLQGAHLLVGYRLPNAYETPFGMLFKKVDDNINATTHTFVLFYKSMMLQIFLPFHIDDFRHYSDLRCPALRPLFYKGEIRNLQW
jgi:hypothetical protein